MNLGLCVCTFLKGTCKHDGQAFRMIKSQNFLRTATIKNVEAIREHFMQHRKGTDSWKETKHFETAKKDISQTIVDKGCLLIPMCNLSYNFFEHSCVSDFIMELCEHRVRSGQKSLVLLLDKLKGGQGKSIQRRLDAISSDYKNVC